MRKRKLILFVLLLNLLAHSQDKSELTLKEAINAALKNNISILESEQDIIVAKQKLRQARLMFLPQIYFSGDIVHSNIETPGIIGLEQNYRYISENYDEKYLYGIKTTLLQPIYTGGKLYGNLKLSNAEYNREKAKKKLAELETIYRVKKIYYSAVFYKDLLKEVNTIYENLKKIEAESKNLNPEIIKFEIDLKNEIYELKNKYSLSKLELLNEMGQPSILDFEISEELKPFKTKKIDLNKCIITAIEKRPELKSELYQLEIKNISTDIASMKKYPNIYLGLSYDIFSDSYSSLKTPKFRNDNFITYITIQYPFPYDLWINLNKEKAEQRSSELKKIKLEEEIKLNVIKAYNQYISYTEKINNYLERMEEIDKLFSNSLKNQDNAIKNLKILYELKKNFLTTIYMQINSLIELEKEQAEEII